MNMSRIKQVVLECLRSGLSPHKVAIALAVGICVGIFPIYGPFTLVCVALVWLGRLNAPIVFAGYYGMTFVKPLLIIPFLKLGEWVFQAEPMTISLTELARRFAVDAMGTLAEFGWSFIHATVGWLVTLPLLVLFLYGGSRFLINLWNKRNVFSLQKT